MVAHAGVEKLREKYELGTLIMGNLDGCRSARQIDLDLSEIDFQLDSGYPHRVLAPPR